MDLMSIALVTSLMGGITTPFVEDEHECLAQAVYHEAIGEPDEGKVAIVYNIINRTNKHHLNANTWCDSLYAKNQFPWTTKYDVLPPIPEKYRVKVYQIVYSVVYNKVPDPTNGAMYFYNPDKVKSKFHESRPYSTTIGHHKFFF